MKKQKKNGCVPQNAENLDIACLIDHTFLKPAGARCEIEKLCREARACGFASVCVNPAEVAACARMLRGSPVKVCTVVDFPLGASTLRARCFEALDAIQAGADELDLVINQRLLKYSPSVCEAELRAFSAFFSRARSDTVRCEEYFQTRQDAAQRLPLTPCLTAICPQGRAYGEY
jgi:deoxyribose-phosphate aldolase